MTYCEHEPREEEVGWSFWDSMLVKLEGANPDVKSQAKKEVPGGVWCTDDVGLREQQGSEGD